MSPAVEQLLSLAMELSEDERLELAEALVAASAPQLGPTGEEWLAEVRRRSDEIDAGTVKLSTWAEVKKRAREKLEGKAGG
jgi:putative addiction module component (TIGR02574 family)